MALTSVPDTDTASARRNLRGLVLISYALFLIACVNGVTALIGVIIAYVKRGDAEGTVWKSHFDNLIVVFWVALLAAFAGVVTLPILIGFFIFPVLAIWYFYRTVRGLIRASEERGY